MPLKSAAFSCLLGLSLCTACQTGSPTGTTIPAADSVADAPLRNTRWVLRRLADTPVQTPAEVREAYIQFTDSASQVRGQAACNRFFGKFAQTGADGLSMTSVGSTRMFCDRMAEETKYLQVLQQTTRYRISGDTLRLFAAEQDRVLATFEAVYLH